MKLNIINLETAFLMSFCLIIMMSFILLDYVITLPLAFMSGNDGNGSSSTIRNATNNYLYENCSLEKENKNSLTVMITNRSSENWNSNHIYTIPLSFCIDFVSTSDNYLSFNSENSDRAETGKANLILESNGNISIITNSSDRNRSSVYEVFLGCPVPIPPTYQDQWLLLEFKRVNYDPQEFRIPVIIEDIKPLIEKYEFGCTLIIREFTSSNTISEFRVANTLIV